MVGANDVESSLIDGGESRSFLQRTLLLGNCYG